MKKIPNLNDDRQCATARAGVAECFTIVEDVRIFATRMAVAAHDSGACHALTFECAMLKSTLKSLYHTLRRGNFADCATPPAAADTTPPATTH